LNQRPSGYEPDELPDCSIPHQCFLAANTNNTGTLLVRKGGLEPPRPKALPPQGSVSTNSTTTAAVTHSSRIPQKKKGLIEIIRQFLVQLAKFHPYLFERVLSSGCLFVQFLDHKHP
jgi:hypothetical protein